MSINIMLSFLSNYHLVNNKATVSNYYGDGSEIKGEHTNEAALRYVYEKYKLAKYFCFCSKMVRAEVKYVDENSVEKNITHYNLFKERLRRHISNIDEIIEYVDYNETDLSSESISVTSNGNAADLVAVKEMANAVIKFANPYLNAGTEVVLYLDTTGGFRHANTLMLAVVELLKYSGITIGNILYSNYNGKEKIGKIEDITNIHDVMQLAAGAEAFIAYGKVDVLRRYFDKYSYSKALGKLLKAMESFSDALSLCRSGMLVEAATGLRRAMDNFRKSNCRGLHEVLFQELLLQRIEKEYEIIGDGSNRLSIIRWCLEKGFLQQAMTLYTEWVPDIIVEKRIFYTDDESVKKSCKVNSYTPWSKALLSHHVCETTKHSTVGAEDESSNIANKFKEYALSGGDIARKWLLAINNNESGCISQVLMELEKNDEVVAMMKSGAISFEAVKLKYPKLYSVVHRIYYVNPKSMPNQPLEGYWKNRINAARLRNSIKTLPLEFVKELLELKPVAQAKVAVAAADEAEAIQSAKHHRRRGPLMEMLACGVTKTVVAKDLAIQICDEYNKIRDLRNHINHANEDIIDAREVKEEISIYLYNLESVVNKIE